MAGGGIYLWHDLTLGWVMTTNMPGSTSSGGWAKGGALADGPAGDYVGFGGHTGKHTVQATGWFSQNVNDFIGFLKDCLVYGYFGMGYSTVYFNS